MNKSILTVGIIFLALIALLLLQVLNNYSTGSELDYYLVKETTDAAISDSIDGSFYYYCGIPRIDKEKFVESFIYRFANSVDAARTYDIGFYDINECPPKVSVKVDSDTLVTVNPKDKSDTMQGDISTSYDAILETKALASLATDYGLDTNVKKGQIGYDECRSMLKTGWEDPESKSNQ